MTVCLYAGPVALDNVVLCSSVDVLKGWLDSFSFGCQGGPERTGPRPPPWVSLLKIV